MKIPTPTQPNFFTFLGLVGLLMGSLLLLYMEIGLEAPNASTLYYRQSILLPFVILLCVVSLGLLIKGIWMRRQERSSQPMDEDR